MAEYVAGMSQRYTPNMPIYVWIHKAVPHGDAHDCKHTHAWTHMSIHMAMHTYTHVNAHVDTHVCTHGYTCLHTCAHRGAESGRRSGEYLLIATHMHAYMCTCTHAAYRQNKGPRLLTGHNYNAINNYACPNYIGS